MKKILLNMAFLLLAVMQACFILYGDNVGPHLVVLILLCTLWTSSRVRMKKFE